MVEIKFPDTPAKEAGAIANRLREAIIAEGVPAKLLNVDKPTRDTMDVGSVLQLEWGPLLDALKEHGITLAHLAIIVWEVCKPAGKVTISSGDKSITLSDAEIEKAKIDEVFRSLNEK